MAIIRGECKCICYLSSIIFPFYPEKSVIIKSCYLPFQSKKVKITCVSNDNCDLIENITSNYVMEYDKIENLYMKGCPAFLKIKNGELS